MALSRPWLLTRSYGNQRHSEALRGTQRHSEALRGTQWHSEAISRPRLLTRSYGSGAADARAQSPARSVCMRSHPPTRAERRVGRMHAPPLRSQTGLARSRGGHVRGAT